MEREFPVVDFQKLCEQEELIKLREACEKRGCFRVINHHVPTTLMTDMKAVAKSLHELPQEIKCRNTSDIPFSGYAPLRPTGSSPLYEGLGIYDMHATPQALDDFCSQLNVSSHHRQILKAYGEAIHGLSSSIAQKMAESLGVVAAADFSDWPFVLKINKYHFSPERVDSLGLKLHSDTGFITLLQDDEKVGGLETMDDDSGSYVPVPPLSGSFLCIIGDVGHAWSNGRFHNVKHRVVCKEATARLSISAFMLASRNDNVDAPKDLVDPSHPRLYRPFKYEDLRMFSFSKDELISEFLDQFRIIP